MKSHRPFTRAFKSASTARRMAVALACLIPGLLLAAPAAMAWNGNLIVRKVNIGGPADDSFNFQVTKTPNAYFAVWNPGTKSFSLQGASSPQGPFTEGVNQQSYNELWAGHDLPYSDWVVYSVKEIAKPGYTTTVSCTIDGDWNALGEQVLGQYGAWTYTPGTDNGDTTVATTLRWLNNEPYTTTCTFTNTYRARIKVTKKFDDEFSANPRVDMVVNDKDVDAVSPQASETFGNDYDSDWIEVAPGSSVDLAETQVEGTTLSNYTSKLECREGQAGEYGDWFVVSQTTSGTLEGVAPGKDYVCRFMNTRKGGKVTIKKIVVDSAGNAISGTFSFTGDLGPLDVAANGDGVASNVAANQSYNVTETIPAGYTLTKVACVDTANGEGEGSSVNGATATANVQPGENVVCTFTNTKNPDTPPSTPPTGASGNVSPSGASGGVTQRRGTARISGTVGCATGNYATVAVTGSKIKKVTYTVNGKKVKTLTKPNAGSKYQLRYRTRSLKAGAYKVNAKVEFVSSSGTKAKNLKLQFSRCTPRVVRPTFTG